MRVLISLGAFVLVFLIGVKTEWISVSNAAQTNSNVVAQEDPVLADRAYETLVLGQTRVDATSGELLDAAVTRGEITAEQSLLYGVFLACGDPRLPARFHGHDTAAPAKNILWEADVNWSSLSPDTQQALRAFFTEGAPSHRGLACASDIARLKSDPSVWWAPALQPAGFQVAAN